MDKSSELIALCDRFFDAIEQNDFETLESCCAPEYVVWHSHDNKYEPRDSNLPMLKRGMVENPTVKRYTNRRVMPFEGGFVQQHRMTIDWPDAPQGRMDVCFIAYVVNNKISRIYEYFDTGQRHLFRPPGAGGTPAAE